MDIKLNFINRSQDTNNSSIVIFQQNVADDFGEIAIARHANPTAAKTAIAWKVLQGGVMLPQTILYPQTLEVSAQDGNNTTAKMTATGPSAFTVGSTSGDVLQLSAAPATSMTEVEIRNNLGTGAINANCYRSGVLLCCRAIPPQQKAAFSFGNKIHIGVLPKITEGSEIDAKSLGLMRPTALDLTGIAKADIVMEGSSGAYRFRLENVQKA